MLKTLYTKWPAYESLTPCLWRPGFQISSGSVSRHQHNTSLGQANARFFNSPFLLLFQTLLFSSRSQPSLLPGTFQSLLQALSTALFQNTEGKRARPLLADVFSTLLCTTALYHSQSELYCCIFLYIFVVSAQWKAF